MFAHTHKSLAYLPSLITHSMDIHTRSGFIPKAIRKIPMRSLTIALPAIERPYPMFALLPTFERSPLPESKRPNPIKNATTRRNRTTCLSSRALKDTPPAFNSAMYKSVFMFTYLI